MNDEASSQQLHPKHGARFVMLREDESYRVEVYLPGDLSLRGRLHWPPEGRATVEFEEELRDTGAWIREESLKLARVLDRTRKSRIVRWRPAPTGS